MSLEQSIQNLADAIKYHADAVKLAKTSDAPTSVSVDIIPADVAAEVEAVKAETEQVTPKKEAKKVKPAKAKTKAVKEEADEVVDEVVEAADITANDVRTAAMAVRDEVSRDELSGALKKFKAKKISDLDESKYGEFVAYCGELVEAGLDD